MGSFARDARGEGISPGPMAGRSGDTNRVTVSHIHLPQIQPSASEPSPRSSSIPLQLNQPPGPHPALPAGADPARQPHPSALAPSLHAGSVPLPWLRPPPLDPAPHQDSGDHLGGSAPFPPTSPSLIHAPSCSHSHACARRAAPRRGQLPPRLEGGSRLQEGGSLRRRVGLALAPHPRWGRASRRSPLPPSLPPHSRSRHVPPTPAALPKHRANGDKPAESDFCEHLFPPSKSTSRRKQRG